MESKEPVAEGTERALGLFSEKTDLIAFERLLEKASELSLFHTPDYLRYDDTSIYEPKSAEQKIIQDIGARGLRYTLEVSLGYHPHDSGDEARKPLAYSAIQMPDAISNSTNLIVLENTERFGRALIDQSFRVLGTDAPAMAKKLQDAQTDEEALDAIAWLDSRLFAINKRDTTRSRVDEDEMFYPPYRLSPVIIGQHPHTTMSPSCLGSSIIATSFFERAGLKTIHADINVPSSEGRSTALALILELCIKNEAITSGQRSALQHLRKQTEEWQSREMARHSAVYVKLPTNWLQFDPLDNGTNIQLSDTRSMGSLDTTYDTLKEWSQVIPNIELSSRINKHTDGIEANVNLLLAFEIIEKTIIPSGDSIKESLLSMPEEASLTYLYDTLILPALQDIQIDGDIKLKKKAKEPFSYELFRNCFKSFVQWHDEWEVFIKKCNSDSAYLNRRVEDIQGIHVMMAALAGKIGAETTQAAIPHLVADLALPAMHVGSTVLHDFAVYDNYPLSSSFWLTHWAGDAAALENINNPIESERDERFMTNGLALYLHNSLANLANNGIIMEFLSKHSPKEGDTDGDRQEEAG